METVGLMSVEMIDAFVLICHSGRFVRVPYPSTCFNIHIHVSPSKHRVCFSLVEFCCSYSKQSLKSSIKPHTFSFFFLSFENACLKVTDEQSNTLWDINLVIWSHFYFRENINTQMPQHPTLTPPRWPNLHINCNLQFSKRLLKRSWN